MSGYFCAAYRAAVALNKKGEANRMKKRINLSNMTLEKAISLLERFEKAGWRIDAIEIRTPIHQAWTDITFAGG